MPLPSGERILDHDLDAVGELATDGEVGRRVVAVVDGRVAVLERDRMHDVHRLDRVRARCGPLCPMAHWAMSTWWAPQSVIFPPEYSYHQRNS